MELIARIRSIFRRIEFDKAQTEISEVIKISDIVINNSIKKAEFNGMDIGLSRMEFLLLYYLAVNSNRAVSRGELLDKVWGFENEVETRATDDMIKRIRKKLSDSGSVLKIDTIWGFGFRLINKE